jgi:hypothetical protein
MCSPSPIPPFIVSSGAAGTFDAGTFEEIATLFTATLPSAAPGGVGVIVTLLTNTSSISENNDLIVDLVGPVTAPPAVSGGVCNAPPPLAEAVYDTGPLQVGVENQIQMTMTWHGAMPLLQQGEQYALVFRMAPGSVNTIALTAQCGSVVTFTRSGSLASSGCLPDAAWTESGNSLDSYVTFNDGCDTSAAVTCGSGVCARTIPACDANGNRGVCNANSCDTAHPCVLNPEIYSPTYTGPANAGILSGAPCVFAGSSTPYTGGTQWGGVCADLTETCNGYDDDCNGLTDEGLGFTTCGGDGGCETTVYDCSLAPDNTAACTWPTGQTLPGAICPPNGTPGAPTVCAAFEPAGCP